MSASHLDEAGHRLVSDAVGAAEANTSGEIVTIVAERSDGYTDVALCWAVGAAFLAMVIYASIPEFYLAKIDWLLGNWQSDWTLREVLTIGLGIGVAKFIGVMLLQLIPAVKFLLVPGRIKTARTHARATNLFRVGTERRTTGRTGILIYLSMREHRAEILADRAIADKVDAEVWGDAMAAMLAEIRQGRVAEGMVAAVEEVGKVLAQHFPRADDDHNELPDRLIEI